MTPESPPVGVAKVLPPIDTIKVATVGVFVSGRMASSSSLPEWSIHY